MIGCGLLGAIVSGILVDKTKRFIEIVRVCYPGATLGFVMVGCRRALPLTHFSLLWSIDQISIGWCWRRAASVVWQREGRDQS